MNIAQIIQIIFSSISGIMGITWLIISVLYLTGALNMEREGFNDTHDKKAISQFLGKTYLLIGVACSIGSILGFLKLCPAPILLLWNFIYPCFVWSAIIYATISKRFKRIV